VVLESNAASELLVWQPFLYQTLGLYFICFATFVLSVRERANSRRWTAERSTTICVHRPVPAYHFSPQLSIGVCTPDGFPDQLAYEPSPPAEKFKAPLYVMQQKRPVDELSPR
jgi:hypothetical protein